jgi:aryl-alcohol dehydrogenase-like predicted oxidoreductase
MGRTGLSVSSVGFGAYRLGESSVDQLTFSLRSGINLVDTSTHYGDEGSPGASEQIIGHVLKNTPGVAREEVVIMTKVGHIDLAEGQSEASEKGAVKCNDRTWHSLDPDFIRKQVMGSSLRLQTKPDIVLLHNPEFHLSDGRRRKVPMLEAWEKLYHDMGRAFKTLEELKADGAIAGYGVSGNFLSCYYSVSGGSNVYEALDLQRVLGAAVVGCSLSFFLLCSSHTTHVPTPLPPRPPSPSFTHSVTHLSRMHREQRMWQTPD